jgi:quercetin dioxygenase-like cupin family protein
VVEQADDIVPDPGARVRDHDRDCGSASLHPPRCHARTLQAAPTARETVTPAFSTRYRTSRESIIAIVASYPPGGKTPPHHHARSAFVTGYVLSGSIRSQVDDGKVQVVHAGESWSEAPGAHHPISENASATEPAKLLAIFVVDTDDKELTTLEEQ